MITGVTPWSITAVIEDESITLVGEMYPCARYGQADFFGLAWAVTSDDEGAPLELHQKLRLLQLLEREATDLGVKVRLDLSGVELMSMGGLHFENGRTTSIKEFFGAANYEKVKHMIEGEER